jgi:hypothetical protein
MERAWFMFISYVAEDWDRVRSIVDRIGPARCFIDRNCIAPGDPLIEAISEGMAAASVCVIFWSRRSSRSKWVREEIRQASTHRVQDGLRVVPVKLDGTRLPPELDGCRYLDIRDGEDVIVDALRGLLPESPVAVAGSR